jgi:tRNA1Val (adenine37-N6)-methyltransferase
VAKVEAATSATIAGTTHDWLFAGTVSLRQPAKRAGYRVNVDAILLAAFAARVLPGGSETTATEHDPAAHAVDLGAGVGAVGLSLLHLGGARTLTMVEIDAAVASLATANVSANEWADRARVVTADVANAARELGAVADLVVCNPPYVTPGRGRAPAAPVESARYGHLPKFVTAARAIAGRRARVCFVYPAIEAMTLLAALREHGLEPKRLRTVHGRAATKARVVLVEAMAAKAGGLAIEPPLVETTDRGSPTTELASLLAAPRATPDRRGDRAKSRTPRER